MMEYYVKINTEKKVMPINAKNHVSIKKDGKAKHKLVSTDI